MPTPTFPEASGHSFGLSYSMITPGGLGRAGKNPEPGREGRGEVASGVQSYG